MAGWLSSKLKAAEKLLQQIDEQAAGSLRKQEHQHLDAVGSQFDNGVEISWKKTPEALNRLPQPGKSWHQQQSSGIRRSSPTHTLSEDVPGVSKMAPTAPHPHDPGDFGKQDWTELLGSSDLATPVSAARSVSSVGSSDYGQTHSALRSIASRTPHYTGKGGADVQPNNTITPASRSLSAGLTAVRPLSVQASRTKPSISYSVDSVSASELSTGSLIIEDERLPRRLEFGVSDVEGARKHDSREHGLEDAVSHTYASAVKVDGGPVGLSAGLLVQASCMPNPANAIENGHVIGDNGHAELKEIGAVEGLEKGFVEKAEEASDAVQCKVMIAGENAVDPMLGHDMQVPTKHSEMACSEEQAIELIHSAHIQGTGQTEDTEGQDGFLDLSLAHDSIAEEGVVEGTSGSADSKEEGIEAHTRGMGTEIPMALTSTTFVRIVGDAGDEGGDRDISIEGIGEGSSISESGEESSRSSNDSESDSEYEERVRCKREKKRYLAERKAAAAAAAEAARAAIREREEFVARLEKEKETLERLLAESEEKQAREAMDLRMKMTEVTQAVEMEKQQHSITRREALAHEAQLEADNAELAKALAAAERNLEDEMMLVAEGRSQVEAMEVARSDLERRIASLHFALRQPLQSQAESAQHDKLERDSFQQQQLELRTSLEQCQMKARELEEKIALASEAHITPSAMELELETRLNQLTDHLIQKQAQVEALSTEKATLHFRLEAVSNTLREEKSAARSRASKRNKGFAEESDWSLYNDDLEYGLSKPYSSKDKAFFLGLDSDTFVSYDAGSHPLMHVIRQIDTLFLGGARILRTHVLARGLAGFYLLALHGWVLFILFTHAHSGQEVTPNAVVQVGANTLSMLAGELNATTAFKS